MRASLSAAVLALALGCGFAPTDELTGRRTGDGIGPWKDLGPVQLCLGNEFVGPPDSSPGGLCAASEVVEAPCSSDGDCQSREACVCGRCIVQYCTAASDCGTGRTCSFSEGRCDTRCADAADCAPGEECFNGACRGRCFSDADCQTGEVCNSSNRCVTARCAEDADCLGDERCRVQRVPRVAIEPVVLARARADEPAFVMWLEMSEELRQERRAIWRATSADGRRFRLDPAQPVLEDADMAGAPSMIRAADGYYLYYAYDGGGAIKVAHSTDGVAFSTPTAALTGGTGDAAVRAPAAVAMPGGEVVVYYELGDGRAIGWAEGSPGGPLQPRSTALSRAEVTTEPADPDEAFWLDVEALRSPTALLTPSATGGHSLRIWFSAFGRESGDSEQFGETVPIEPNYSIGYAAAADPGSPDALTPWPYNPVFDRVSAFLDHRSELGPAVVQVSDGSGNPLDGYLLYYTDAEADTSTDPPSINRLGVAGNGNYGRK